MPAEIVFKSSAERKYRRLPREIQGRFASAFKSLAEGPTRPRPGLDVKPLRGVKDTWRLRVGDYRGIYEVEPEKVRFTRFRAPVERLRSLVQHPLRFALGRSSRRGELNPRPAPYQGSGMALLARAELGGFDR